MGKEQAMDVDVHNQTGLIKTEIVELDSSVSKKQRVTEYNKRLSQFSGGECSVYSNELTHVEMKVELKKRCRYECGSIEEVDVTSSYMPTPNYRLKPIQEGFKKLKKKMEDLEEREKMLVPKLKHSLSMMQRMLPEMIPPSGSIEEDQEVDVTSSYIPTPFYVDRLKIIQQGFEKSKKKMDDLEEREKVLVPKLKHSLSMLQRMLPEMIPPS